MALYKKIGQKSPIKSFRKRKSAKMSKRMNRRVPKSLVPSISNRHYAQITETVELTDIDANTTNYEVFQLSQFNRAFTIAPSFKFYRAKKVLFKYEPVYNLFSEGGGETIPLAFMVMNRSQDKTNYTAAQLMEQGAVPRKFTSAISMEYTPNWCSAGLTAFSADISGNVNDIISQGVRKNYGWLSTPSNNLNGNNENSLIIAKQLSQAGYSQATAIEAQVIYNGHFAHFQQAVEGTVPKLCRRTVTVVWEFKGPRTVYSEVSPNVNEAVLPDKQDGAPNPRNLVV